MRRVTLFDMLEAKEKRVARRQEMLCIWRQPVISAAINLPGSEKDTVMARRLLHYAMNALVDECRRQKFDILEMRQLFLPTGPEGHIAIAAAAGIVKEMCLGIEERTKYGRLLDLDVYAADGTPMSRTDAGLPPRNCIVCGQPVLECMRERRHDPVELCSAWQEIANDFAAEEANACPPIVWDICTAAIEAMLMEVACTPAPGLVDRVNSGAHSDMDFFTFIRSTAALFPAMTSCVWAGLTYGGTEEDLLRILRKIGQAGETRMLVTTAGVNTQRGILFLLGILCASAGVAWRRRGHLSSQEIIGTAVEMCTGMVEKELAVLEKKRPLNPTAGERLYLQYRATGIRGELEKGLPSVRDQGLPRLREGLAAGLPLNDALLHALLSMVAVTEDTTILNRHDLETLRETQQIAADFMARGGMFAAGAHAELAAMDQQFIRRRISPGGSADLLAVTYFLHSLDGKAKE